MSLANDGGLFLWRISGDNTKNRIYGTVDMGYVSKVQWVSCAEIEIERCALANLTIYRDYRGGLVAASHQSNNGTGDW